MGPVYRAWLPLVLGVAVVPLQRELRPAAVHLGHLPGPELAVSGTIRPEWISAMLLEIVTPLGAKRTLVGVYLYVALRPASRGRRRQPRAHALAAAARAGRAQDTAFALCFHCLCG